MNVKECIVVCFVISLIAFALFVLMSVNINNAQIRTNWQVKSVVIKNEAGLYIRIDGLSGNSTIPVSVIKQINK